MSDEPKKHGHLQQVIHDQLKDKPWIKYVAAAAATGGAITSVAMGGDLYDGVGTVVSSILDLF